MSDQSEFGFGEPESEPNRYPYVPGYMKQSETSKQAAEEIHLSAKSLRELVFKFIEKHSLGATCDEVEVALNLRHQTASARITELRLASRLVARGTRPTRSGRRADILFAVSL